MPRQTIDRSLDSLVLDLIEWVAREERSYAQTMEVWRTSCPRLTVWEEAVDRGLVARAPHRAGGVRIMLTAAGRDFLRRERQTPTSPAD
ncbi:MAG: hypothetical protein ACK4UO_15405 [Pseudolabrys sp.]